MQQNQEVTGKALRDEGVMLTLEHVGPEWHDQAIAIAMEVFTKAGYNGALFEDVRECASDRGLGIPPSSNAWGAVCLTLSKRGVIVRTGEIRASKFPSNHARAAAMWRLASLEKEA